MNRWSPAYPGTHMVRHRLPRVKDSAAAMKVSSSFRTAASNMPTSLVYWSLRSDGYGRECRYWLEMHFSNEDSAHQYQLEHKGEMFYCLPIFSDGDGNAKTKGAEDWLEQHRKGLGTESNVEFLTIYNEKGYTTGKGEVDLPIAYVYVNDLDVLMLAKLSMGGR